MKLLGPYDDQNIFAKIIRGEAPAAIVYQDAETLAFMDLFPQSEGHVLVIPKTSTARVITEVEPAALAAMVQALRRIARAIEVALKPDGLVVAQLNGPVAGQTVNHLHFHLIPRYVGKEMKGHGQAPMADPAALRAQAAAIAAAIGD